MRSLVGIIMGYLNDYDLGTIWFPTMNYMPLSSITKHLRNAETDLACDLVQAFSACSRIKGDRVDSPPCWFTKCGRGGGGVGKKKVFKVCTT